MLRAVPCGLKRYSKTTGKCTGERDWTHKLQEVPVNSVNPPIDVAEAQRQISEVLASAQRLGVEVNPKEAVEWIMAVSAAERGSALAQDAQNGVFGDRIALLDFDSHELEHLRPLAQKVRLDAHPNIESAIAIAGSTAQGKVQLFPGDTDFFERINIKSASEHDARETLRDLLRATALRAFTEPDVVLLEVNFGVY